MSGPEQVRMKPVTCNIGVARDISGLAHVSVSSIQIQTQTSIDLELGILVEHRVKLSIAEAFSLS
jgi:hypothetical protein